MLARALRRPLEWPGFVFVIAIAVVLLAATVARAPQREETQAAAREAPVTVSVPREEAGIASEASPPPAPRLSAREVLSTEQGPVVVVPPRAGLEARSPMMTVLHGACSDVAWTCRQTAGAAPDQLLVSCPTGNAQCDGAADWAGDGETKATWLDAIDAATRAELALAPAAPRGDILVGFSRGAFVARDVAYARPGRYRGLVLIGAALSPEPALLRANGIRRVVLAAGNHDGAAPTMRAARDKLVRGGVEARFVSLGPVFHTLPDDTAARLADSLRWVTDDEGVL